MKKVNSIFLFIILLICNHILAMEPKTHLLIVPGFNDVDSRKIHSMFPYFTENKLTYLLQNPYLRKSNQQDLNNPNQITIPNNVKDDDCIILYGLSQGTIPAIQYTSNNQGNVAALILDNVRLADDLQSVPTLSNLPDDTPIIIMHEPYNQQSLQDAQALYAYLRKDINNHQVYFFTQENQFNQQIAIDSILKLYDLIPSDGKEQGMIQRELKENYQPQIQNEWLDHFDVTLNKKEPSKPLTTAAKILAIGYGIYGVCKLIGWLESV